MVVVHRVQLNAQASLIHKILASEFILIHSNLKIKPSASFQLVQSHFLRDVKMVFV